MFKRIVTYILQNYVQSYFRNHPDLKLIVVVGSVGKTSTKHAVATLLSEKYRVRMHAGNYNSEISVPLAILGLDLPSSLISVGAWLNIFRQARQLIRTPADVDVIVQELGTDSVGDIVKFGKYLQPNLAIVTAVTEEHMEFFGTLDAVAREELSVGGFSDSVIYNFDNVASDFLQHLNNQKTSSYGLQDGVDYLLESQATLGSAGYTGIFTDKKSSRRFDVQIEVAGRHSLLPIVGALSTACLFGLTDAEIVSGLAKIKPVPGRMNLLSGLNGMTVIDDTYNSSPAAVAAALETLYAYGNDQTKRIAVLGDMRELGATSMAAHQKIGQLCDPVKLDYLVTVGPDMKTYALPIAEQNGCRVFAARDALEAGEFVRQRASSDVIGLFKGSQNTIFLEEAVKQVVDEKYHSQLVRQSSTWLAHKQKYFQSLQ